MRVTRRANEPVSPANVPATKADVQSLRALIERFEKNLLTEFHKWAAQTYEVIG